MMNDRDMLMCIAKGKDGKVTATQIADQLDVALEDVQAQLASLIHVQDVEESDGFTERGHPCKKYGLTKKFKESDQFTTLAPLEQAAGFSFVGTSDFDRAVEFVRQRGRVSSSEMHAMLGLPRNVQPSEHLKEAIESGRLIKAGKFWELGVVELSRTPEDKVIAVVESPAPQVDQLWHQRKPAADQMPLNIGKWSDGTMELRRGTDEPFKLSRDEVIELRDFLALPT